MEREPSTGVKRQVLQRLQESRPVPAANQRARRFPSPHPLCPPALDGEPDRNSIRTFGQSGRRISNDANENKPSVLEGYNIETTTSASAIRSMMVSRVS